MSRRQYPFHLIESKWQRHWDETQAFRAWNPGENIPADHAFAKRHEVSGAVEASKLPPKRYILDMFPYPSGAGLHVGHPEGYTATDILSRFRRAQGFNVLHPIGWDAFGLPAEQYAIKTGQHPRVTTEQNVANFTRQIKSLGFSYDWSRTVDTTDPKYVRWTQWIFLQLYNSYFDPSLMKAQPICVLEDALSEYPQKQLECDNSAYLDGVRELLFTNTTPETRISLRADFILSKRLAYVSDAPVNWCPELGTVLANEEVKDGKSEVGGFPVVRKPMRQWMLRITAYAERLLQDLDSIDWSDSLKEMQRNWIGKSEGATVKFQVSSAHSENSKLKTDDSIEVFTTRPDTLFGATYMVLSPEHKLVESICSTEQQAAVKAYQAEVATKSDLERTELAKEKTGVFTGAFAINPANNEKIPIWIADYVLISYGTGAIMAVPAHDTRDFEFATKFELPIVQVVEPQDKDTDWQGFVGDGTSVNSSGPDIAITGLPTLEAKNKITTWLEEKGLGEGTVNYKLRDWLFSRQRYWGEPFPIIWRKDSNGNLHHEALPESELPLLQPELSDFKPTSSGEPPLARATDWVNLPDGAIRETNTMPQWAGSCWYYLRYLDAGNDQSFCSKEAEQYWMGSVPTSKSDLPSPKSVPGVDLYVGGTEHAVLHLLYARFWHKALFDLGHVSTTEPFFKLVNQGMILGEDGQKMSKSRGNVINPDDVLKEFGADAFRLYEMFMGPLEMVKPWNTQGVEGVYRFLGRVWRTFIDEQSETEFEQADTTTAEYEKEALLKLIKLHASVQDVEPDAAQLKALHACIKKVTEDLEGLRFNTAISAMMVFAKEASAWKVRPISVLKEFLILLQPFSPHVAEELWDKLGAHDSQQSNLPLAYQPWPTHNPQFLAEDTIEIPVQVNGKLREVIQVPKDISREALEEAALNAEKVRLFLDGKTIRKRIVLPGRLVNIVVS